MSIPTPPTPVTAPMVATLVERIRTMRWAFPLGDSRQAGVATLADDIETALADAAALREQLREAKQLAEGALDAQAEAETRMFKMTADLRTAEALALTNGERVTRAEALLARIGGPDEDDCCPVCGEHAPSCSLDADRFPKTSACAGAEARVFLADHV